jgi:endonuclease-3
LKDKQQQHSKSGYINNQPITGQEVISNLRKLYGEVEWRPRYDPITELVFTILSQHTSDVNSERAFSNLIQHFGTIQNIADGDIETISRCIKIGGLNHVKAPRIKTVLNRIRQIRPDMDLTFLKQIPLEQAKAWLQQLPGIGPKSAAVILCFSLGMPAMAVDTHVYRVSKRLGLITDSTTANQAHPILEELVPPRDVFQFHTSLITHGRRTCKAINPNCSECPLAQRCPSSLVNLK